MLQASSMASFGGAIYMWTNATPAVDLFPLLWAPDTLAVIH